MQQCAPGVFRINQRAGMQLKYFGSKAWLAPHMDRLLGTSPCFTLPSSVFLCATCSPEKLQLVRLALLAAGKRGVVHPRLQFGEQISEAKYACAHRDAETARAEKLFVMQ